MSGRLARAGIGFVVWVAPWIFGESVDHPPDPLLDLETHLFDGFIARSATVALSHSQASHPLAKPWKRVTVHRILKVLLPLFAAEPSYVTKVLGIAMRAVRAILEQLHTPLVLSAIVD